MAFRPSSVPKFTLVGYHLLRLVKAPFIFTLVGIVKAMKEFLNNHCKKLSLHYGW